MKISASDFEMVLWKSVLYNFSISSVYVRNAFVNCVVLVVTATKHSSEIKDIKI